MKEFITELLKLVYPENIYCISCGDLIENSRIHGLCDSCIGKIDWDTDNPLRFNMEDFAFSAVYPCCRYGFYPRRIISLFKFSIRPYMARGLGRLMGERLSLALEGKAAKPKALIAVPMTASKEAKRGFNQAELLARFAAEAAGLPYIKGFMEKTEDTASMRKSDAFTRRSLSSEVFRVRDDFAETVKGSYLILVDDVITTGSTCDACSRALLEAGAQRIDILCFAAAPPRLGEAEEDL